MCCSLLWYVAPLTQIYHLFGRDVELTDTFRTLLKKKKRHDPDMLNCQRVSLLTQGRFYLCQLNEKTLLAALHSS